MRVLLDARNLALTQGTGIATYARNVSRLNKEAGNSVDILYEFHAPNQKNAVLDEMAFFDPRHGSGSDRLDRMMMMAAAAKQIAWPKPVRAEHVPLGGFVDRRPLQSRLPMFDRILTAPLIYRKASAYFYITGRFLPVTMDPLPDVAHWTTPHPIYVPGARNVYTVHDVIPLKLPYTTIDNRKRYYGMIKGAVRHADQIISISETTTNDLLEIAPEAAGKITNTSQSVALPESLLREPADALLQNLFGLQNKKFFVFFAAIEPKKNVGRLIEALLASKSPYPLLIIGKKGWLYEDELRPLGYAAAKAQLAGAQAAPSSRVVLIDYVSFPMLIRSMKAARALLFPSLYEGFGLPILEAMLCGTPVMTSNTGAMAEVAPPGTALLVDPLDVPAMSRAIEQLAADDALCARLSAAGLNRARDFSWDRYRGSVVKAYERALAASTASNAAEIGSPRAAA